jgi:DNA-directed RNA polymerase III subunit RPC4
MMGAAVTSSRSGGGPGASSGGNYVNYFNSGGRGAANTFEPEYPDEGDGPLRKVNIEVINLDSGDEDDDDIAPVAHSRGPGKTGAKTKGLKPIRIKREEHKERTGMITSDTDLLATTKKEPKENEDGSKAGSKDGTHKGDVEMSINTGDSTKVKRDPDLESPTLSRFSELPQPSSPEQKKRRPSKLDAVKQEPDPSPRKAKTLRHTRPKDKKPVIQTEEDKLEWERHLEDVEILAKELRFVRTDDNTKDKNKGKEVDVEGDVDMDAEPQLKSAEDESDVVQKDGRLYLFQFPPILPRLFNPEKEGPDDLVVTKSTEQVDLTEASNEPPIKKEGEEVVIKTEGGVADRPEQLISEKGWIGKLVVRKSGKVELNWGGTSMAVGRGAPAAFLSNVLLTEEPKGEAEGTATGLGKVMGKFVVTPDWEKIF